MGRVRDAGWAIDPTSGRRVAGGPAARSVLSFLEYWERWAETWEFQALLGARAVAGDEALGRRFVANAHDVAYPRDAHARAGRAIRRMRVRMEEERVKPRGRGGSTSSWATVGWPTCSSPSSCR